MQWRQRNLWGVMGHTRRDVAADDLVIFLYRTAFEFLSRIYNQHLLGARVCHTKRSYNQPPQGNLQTSVTAEFIGLNVCIRYSIFMPFLLVRFHPSAVAELFAVYLLHFCVRFLVRYCVIASRWTASEQREYQPLEIVQSSLWYKQLSP